ncbi:UNVERIFIED_CONTAM: hypothetical protein FKN15_002788 [Acipenser sinensis]
MLKREMDCSQLPRIYVQGMSSYPTRIGCICRHQLTVVYHSHPYAFAQEESQLQPEKLVLRQHPTEKRLVLNVLWLVYNGWYND